jgi:hypothetical protein
MARIVAIAPDLFFGSKISETLTSAGHEVVMSDSPEAGAELVIVDLDQIGTSLDLPPGVPVLAFYSHVDVETKQRGEEAGYDLVVPRSRMAREMPDLVSRLVGG